MTLPGLPPLPNDPIVGHKTFRDEDGSWHEPLRQSEANAILAASEAAKLQRAADMPTEEDAARAMWSAYQRLRELGWRETCYGPTNEVVRLIEPGSSGIHEGERHNPWPEKTWWIYDGDLWPSTPCLFKAKEQPTALAIEKHARSYASAAIKAERERAEQDARRYRWLREWLVHNRLLQAQFCKPPPEQQTGHFWVLFAPQVIDGGTCEGFGKTEEAAIDAAMAQEQPS